MSELRKVIESNGWGTLGPALIEIENTLAEHQTALARANKAIEDIHACSLTALRTRIDELAERLDLHAERRESDRADIDSLELRCDSIESWREYDATKATRPRRDVQEMAVSIDGLVKQLESSLGQAYDNDDSQEQWEARVRVVLEAAALIGAREHNDAIADAFDEQKIKLRSHRDVGNQVRARRP